MCIKCVDGGGCANGGVALMAGGLLGNAHLASAAVLFGDRRLGGFVVEGGGGGDGGCGRVR